MWAGERQPEGEKLSEKGEMREPCPCRDGKEGGWGQISPKEKTSLSVSYCFITNYPTTQQLKTLLC
jgi:hypothetical protein